MGTCKVGNKGMDMRMLKRFLCGGFQRGQVYSLIAVLIAIPLFLFIVFYMTTSQTIKSGITEKIIADQLHQTEKIMEKDFSNAIGISGKRATLAATNKVVIDGIPLASGTADSGLRELILNGSLDGNESLIMVDNTIEDWRNRILNIDTGFDIYLNYSNLQIENHNGFNLKVTVNLEVNVSDSSGTARIDKALEKEILVSMEDLEDPIFALNTGGFVSRIIKKYPYPYYANKTVIGTGSSGNCSGIVSFDPGSPDSSKILVVNNASTASGSWRGVVGELTNPPSGISCYIIGATGAINKINYSVQQSNYSYIYLDTLTTSVWSLPIKEGIEQGHYYPGDGPNFLERLEGNLSSSANSFETFVNIPQLQAAGIPIKEDQISVAHLYFQSQIINGVSVRGLPDWFRINIAYATKYNLNELR